MDNVYDLAFDALMECDFLLKSKKVNELYALYEHKNLDFSSTQKIEIPDPGRPEKPNLVRFVKVPKRNKTDIGMIQTIHAICHIEFNAINLALDAAYRFENISEQFTQDWLRVAFEENKHFNLIRNYLVELGFEYGDFDAHNGLWKMTTKTDYDPLVRMALVPRVLEARGLDATPGIMKKFKNSKFSQMVDILQVIYDDEIGHVKIGNHWYKYLCNQRNLNYIETFDTLIKKHLGSEGLRGPFNIGARIKAGFNQAELEMLNITI